MTELLVTGGTGMVGKAIQRNIPDNRDAVFLSSKDYDLTEPSQVKQMMSDYEPSHVVHLAARVGGVKANTDYVADFFRENILINTNVLHYANEAGVENLVSLLSTCVYPDAPYVDYPLTENQLHMGPPHDSNFGYAYAKRMVEVHTRALRQQYGRNYKIAIPNNIYGSHDNFDLNDAHVVPSVIRKIYEAKYFGKVPVFWGDGSPVREFTYVDDIANCLLFLAYGAGVHGSDRKEYDTINIGTSEQVSIKRLVDMVCAAFGYSGEIRWSEDMPSGQQKKPSDSSKFYYRYLPFERGIQETCKWFANNYPNVRGVNL